MASKLGRAQRARTLTLTKLVDAQSRVRAVLACDGPEAVLTFYGEDGLECEVVRGVLPVSAVLFRMLNDPACHPEIVGRAPPPSARDRSSPPSRALPRRSDE